MALSRRTGSRFQASIWPGFVDAMTGLLLVLMFVLTIFMVVQFVLTERISGQETELDALSGEVAALAQALGLEESTNAQLEARLGALNASLNDARGEVSEQAALIAALTIQRDEQTAALDAAQSQITSFEAQVAGLLADRDTALGQVEALETKQDELLSAQQALDLALAAARSEVDAQTEIARLAAARREALDALVADLRARNADANAQVAELTGQVAELSDAETARLAEAAAAEALREKLNDADAELTAMTLALEAQRQKAEDTLTLLAAARAAEGDLDTQLAAALVRLEAAENAAKTGAEAETELARLRERVLILQAELDAAQNTLTADRETLRAQLTQALAAKLAAEMLAEDTATEAEKRDALLAAAQQELSTEQEISAKAQRQTELLNQQVAALRSQLGNLQALLDDATARDAAKNIELQSLGSDLNTALARVAAEQTRRAELEAAERERLEAETKNLEQYRSEFFGRLRDVLGSQEGVRIEGDRFVFSSEVLFPPGGAVLSDDGRAEIAKVANILRSVAGDIPDEIDWVIRVDGHTDNVPLSGTGEYLDNWELSQARALSVVKYMISFLGIPPDRLAANGFGQYQPVAQGDSEDARALNRRIELKFTEK
ncbi:MAG: peptidoglycan -binding protein [Sulfitobacter sp.]